MSAWEAAAVKSVVKSTPSCSAVSAYLSRSDVAIIFGGEASDALEMVFNC